MVPDSKPELSLSRPFEENGAGYVLVVTWRQGFSAQVEGSSVGRCP